MNADQNPTNPSRRRLTRGGMALPVVLASLASKNAFAAVPYRCTISGKLSNNLSPFGPNKDPSASCAVGADRRAVMMQLENDETLFSSVFSPPHRYYADGSNRLAEQISGAPFAKKSQEATLFHVLKLNSAGRAQPPVDLDFSRVAVVLYQNATPGPSDIYPLTRPQVVAMYNAVATNRNYDGITSMGNFTWTPAEVRQYFYELYH